MAEGGESIPIEKAPAVKLQDALTAGRIFVRRLGEIADNAKPDGELLSELHVLRGKIEELYRHLLMSEKEPKPYADTAVS